MQALLNYVMTARTNAWPSLAANRFSLVGTNGELNALLLEER